MSRHDKNYTRTYRLSCSGYYRNSGGTFPNACGAWNKASNAVSYSRVNHVKYGDDIPDWRRVIRSGGDATTSMVGTRTAYKPGGVSVSYYGADPHGPVQCSAGSWTGHYLNALLNLQIPLAPANSDALQQASKNFLGSYLQAKTTWRGGNTIAEFGETVEMLAHPLKLLYSHTWSFAGKVKNIGKVFKRDPVRYGRLLGGLWLGYAFGCRPLFDDIKDAQAALNRFSSDLGAHDTYRVKGTGYFAKSTGEFADSLPAPIGMPPLGMIRVLRSEQNWVYIRGAVIARPPGISEIAENFGVDIYDILPAVWEAVPWSWLADYFVNVAEVLDSMRLASATFSFLNKTVKNSCVLNIGAPFVPAGQEEATGLNILVSGGPQRARCTVVTRGKTPVPYPSWTFRVPGISSAKWCNVAALFAQIAGSKPRA